VAGERSKKAEKRDTEGGPPVFKRRTSWEKKALEKKKVNTSQRGLPRHSKGKKKKV